jgi:hypothetical protein
MKRTVLIILILFPTLTTCGPDVKYLEPQPQGISNLNFIPREYHGYFKNQSDSTYLIIDSFSIKKEWRSTEFIQRDSLEKELKMTIKADTSIEIKDKLLLDKSAEALFLKISLGKDSAKVRVKSSEVLFALSDSQLVRTYRKFCFLNFKTKDGYWLVKTLRMKSDQLDFSELIDSKEIEDNNDLTKITAIKDTTGKVVEYRLNPTRKEIRKILRSKKLESSYKRLKNS